MIDPDRRADAANEIVIEAWRMAKHVGRNAAERAEIYNREMERLEHYGAYAIRHHSLRRPYSQVAFTEV